MGVDLSILIVSLNTRALLLDCLGSLAAARVALDLETIVVDNASADGSADAVADAFPGVTLLRNEANVGFAAGNNQALAAARGRHVLLLNPDTLVPAGSLERLVAHLDGTPTCGVVGPRLEYGDGSFQISALRFTRPWDMFYEYARFPRLLQPQAQKEPRRLIPLAEVEATPVEYVMGAALAIRAEVVARIGPMDEGYFMYAEEVDWCLRAQRAGWLVHYLPTATITHLGGRSTEQVPARMLAYRFASTFRFLQLHFGPREAWMARALMALAACQNGLFAIVRKLAGAQDGPLRAELARNAVVLRTALAGRVPAGL